MSQVIPLDPYFGEQYPGFAEGIGSAPQLYEPFGGFTPADQDRFWYLDFHWPRGLTPLGMIWNEDGYAWATQWAAENLPLPVGRGLAPRVAGTHIYATCIRVESQAEIQLRAKRFAQNLPRFIDDFDGLWAERRDEIEAWWNRLLDAGLRDAGLAGCGAFLREARAFHRRCFEIHFELMYPLLANHLGFIGLCGQLGIEAATAGQFLQGYDTKVMATDRALWRLTAAARDQGLRELFASTAAEDLMTRLEAEPLARQWVREFRRFLSEYGHRTEGTSDVALPSWVEDPTPCLGTVQTFLDQDHDHDFAAAASETIAQRENAVTQARSRLSAQELALFDAGLESCRRANFPAWQDDHNYYIDLRAALPMRWAALRIAELVAAGRRDDPVFLFWPELMDVTSGAREYDEFRDLVVRRREYYERWRARRPQMPKVLGTVPEAVNDPILTEIFGLNETFLRAVRQGGTSRTEMLTGVPASAGKARGRARVLTDADQLHRIAAGEVLVCESTSPNWSPAFAKIAACVCDCGGILSHAAIVGREYHVPTVTAVASATTLIRDGDEVEVDGHAGTVVVIRSGAQERT